MMVLMVVVMAMRRLMSSAVLEVLLVLLLVRMLHVWIVLMFGCLLMAVWVGCLQCEYFLNRIFSFFKRLNFILRSSIVSDILFITYLDIS